MGVQGGGRGPATQSPDGRVVSAWIFSVFSRGGRRRVLRIFLVFFFWLRSRIEATRVRARNPDAAAIKYPCQFKLICSGCVVDVDVVVGGCCLVGNLVAPLLHGLDVLLDDGGLVPHLHGGQGVGGGGGGVRLSSHAGNNTSENTQLKHGYLLYG